MIVMFMLPSSYYNITIKLIDLVYTPLEVRIIKGFFIETQGTVISQPLLYPFFNIQH